MPTGAVAVAMNVTIVAPTAQSHLRVFPANVALPNVSSLNWSAGQSPTPNKVDVSLSPGGKIKLYNHSGHVYVLADVVGYYTPDSLTDLEARLAAVEATQQARVGVAAAGRVSSTGGLSVFSMGTISAERVSTGLYRVRTEETYFDPFSMATLSIDGSCAPGGSIHNVSATGISFRLSVEVRNSAGALTDCGFSFAVYDR